MSRRKVGYAVPGGTFAVCAYVRPTKDKVTEGEITIDMESTTGYVFTYGMDHATARALMFQLQQYFGEKVQS